MKSEHIIYAVSGCAAVVSAVWAIQLYLAGPQHLEAIAFSEYSTINDPLYRPKDIARFDDQQFDGELITGSVSKKAKRRKVARTRLSNYVIVGVFDQIAYVEDATGRIWTLVPGSVLPELGVVRSMEATERKWTLIGSRAVLTTPKKADR